MRNAEFRFTHAAPKLLRQRTNNGVFDNHRRSEDMATATATPTKKKIKFRPTDDGGLIQPSEATDTTSGGIILPDTAKEKPQRGTIIAIGPGKLLDSGQRGEMGVGLGDEVFYGKYAGPEIELP